MVREFHVGPWPVHTYADELILQFGLVSTKENILAKLMRISE